MEASPLSARREEVERRPFLVSLVVLLIRRHREALHFAPQQHLRAPLCRLEGGQQLNSPEAAALVASHYDPGEVVVSPFPNHNPQDPFRAVFKPGHLLRESGRHRNPSVTGERIEANKWQGTHLFPHYQNDDEVGQHVAGIREMTDHDRRYD